MHRWSSGKESTYQCRRCGFDRWGGKIHWRRKWQPTPVFLPGKSHGQRSLMCYIQFMGLQSRAWLSDWAHTYIQLSGLKQHPCIISQFPWLRNLGTVWPGPPLRFLWRHACMLSCVWLFATPWTVAHQAPLSMGLSWQEYCSGLPFPPPGESSHPREWNCISCVDRFFTTWESSGFDKAAIKVLAGTRISPEAPSCLLCSCSCSPNLFSCCSGTHGTFFFKASKKENLSSSSFFFSGKAWNLS